MKNFKHYSAATIVTLILIACGSAINGNYRLQQLGGCNQASGAAMYGNTNMCGETNLSLSQNGSQVSGSGSNSCYTQTLTGTANGNTISNVTLTLTPVGAGAAYGGYNNYNNPYVQQQPQYPGSNMGLGSIYNNPYYGYGQYAGMGYYPGYNAGYNNGYNPGYNTGYNTGYGYGAQQNVVIYTGSLSVSGSGSGSSINGTLQLQGGNAYGCSNTLQITGSKL